MIEPVMPNLRTLSHAVLADYQDWLKAIKQRVASARQQAALAANGELIALYYELGAQILDREVHAQWGSGFIDAFSKDLRHTFPEVGGFHPKICAIAGLSSAFTATLEFGNRLLPNWASSLPSLAVSERL